MGRRLESRPACVENAGDVTDRIRPDVRMPVGGSAREQARRPLLRGADDDKTLDDLAGCVVAESSDALVSRLIRLKQLDGLNHNAVIVGRAPSDDDGKWLVAEAVACGCVIRSRNLSRGYLIRFEDDDLRRAIALQARSLGEKGWAYDYGTIAWHAFDAAAWLLPALAVLTALLAIPKGCRWVMAALAAAPVSNVLARGLRRLAGSFDSDTRMICSEFTIEILEAAGVRMPPELLQPAKRKYRPTPIDLTRWLLGRQDWSSPVRIVPARLDEVLGLASRPVAAQ